MIIHYIQHNFSDWDKDTKYMSRVEKSIFLDLRTMYFGNASKSNGNVDGNDFELLCYRLSCKTEEEINALKLLLKDKFKKVGKVYRHSDWDRQIKNLDWWYQKQGNVGNVQGNEVGNVGNEVSNVQGNAMSNAERTAKAKAERKNIITALQNINLDFDKNAPIATLRVLLAENQSKAVMVKTVTHSNDNGNTQGNVGNVQGNESGNGGNAENQANNHKPLTINHKPNTQTPPNPQGDVCVTDDKTATAVLEKAEQIRQTNAQNIQDWIAPSLDEMRGMLMGTEFSGVLNEQQYIRFTSDMKNHFAEQAVLGKPVVTDSLRKQKLRDWIIRNSKNPLAGKSKPTNQERFGTAADPLAVNLVWGQDVTPVATQTYEEAMAEMNARIQAKAKGYEELS